ncbi:hypothetical protein Tco_0212028 [Tanacetum coccineum]
MAVIAIPSFASRAASTVVSPGQSLPEVGIWHRKVQIHQYVVLCSDNVDRRVLVTPGSVVVTPGSYSYYYLAGKVVSISEASIRTDLIFDDADGIDSLPNQAIFNAIQLMGYEGDLTVLTFNKALFSPQWRCHTSDVAELGILGDVKEELG